MKLLLYTVVELPDLVFRPHDLFLPEVNVVLFGDAIQLFVSVLSILIGLLGFFFQMGFIF